MRLLIPPLLCLSLLSAASAHAELTASFSNDPLIIDLGQDGIHLGEKNVGVHFDLMSTNQPMLMQWVAKNGNDAFLAFDKNGNGIVDNGSELFTNFSFLILENRMAQNGFVDLAQHDHPQLGGNDDGYINQQDQIWSGLSLWLDKNADGISTQDEMISLADVGLTDLGLIAKINAGRHDHAGNQIPLWTWAHNNTSNGHSKFKMVDVFFNQPE